MSGNGDKGYSATELMVCVAARLFEDGTTAFIGTGIPMLAASLAQRLYAPSLVAIFEFGGMGAQLENLPLSVAEARTFHKALSAAGICEMMETAARGFVDYGFLGGAQIDMYGNLNTTVIGEYRTPKVRLPGSGGGNDVGSMCWRTIAIMRHDKRRFVPKVDFVTTPGFISGPGAREEAGLPAGTGPMAVITGLCRMGFDPTTCRMRLDALAPDVTVEEVVDNTGFELLMAEKIEQIDPPSMDELRLLRDEIDPTGLYI